MHGLFKSATQIQKLLDKQRWKYCFIGGIAVQKWGQVRVTKDVDLTLLTGFGKEEEFIDKLLSHFDKRIPEAREFALQHRVLLLVDEAGMRIDVSCGAFPFEQSAVQRAKKVQLIPGTRLKLCTAEDLIVYKAFANRGIDWFDIEGVIARQTKAKLDWKYIFEQLTPLAGLKEEPEIVPKLEAMMREA
jgi:predicted nucleotidyltransferase